MDEIKLNDEFKIDDDHSHIRGIVSVYAGDKLLFTRENMIVESGRKGIYSKLFDIVEDDDTTLARDYNFLFSGCIMGDSNELTTAKADITKFGSNPITIIAKTATNILKENDNTQILRVNPFSHNDYENSGLVRKFTIEIPSDDIGRISSLGLKKMSCFGLLFKYKETHINELFSRVVFPPYTLNSNTGIKIEYYLYF